ncbi:MAG: hypothetical protein KIT11_00520 [Fimbriimonadaceae bacterium]|nr:hypothetical protein [Fimbriimonadaceae bacterium]QYK55143.1 MAG: hypothetical protein KF733_09015 [Fimbriimonadaceae bacterium]
MPAFLLNPYLAFGTAILGLLIAATSLLSVNRDLPIAIFIGAAVYLIGGLWLTLVVRGKDVKVWQLRLRFVRLGFVAVFLLTLFQISRPS